MEENVMYRKVVIKSESDLPKERTILIAHFKYSDRWTDLIYFDTDEDDKYWLSEVDYYLLPVPAIDLRSELTKFTEFMQRSYKRYAEPNGSMDCDEAYIFFVPDGCEHPERLVIENQMPACASCNINKHSMSLEDFRSLISGFIKHLNELNTQYKIAKRYELVKEDIKPIVFYFETFNPLKDKTT